MKSDRQLTLFFVTGFIEVLKYNTAEIRAQMRSRESVCQEVFLISLPEALGFKQCSLSGSLCSRSSYGSFHCKIHGYKLHVIKF